MHVCTSEQHTATRRGHADLGIDPCTEIRTGSHVEVKGALRRNAIVTGWTTHQLPVPSIVQGDETPHSVPRLCWTAADILVGQQCSIHPFHLRMHSQALTHPPLPLTLTSSRSKLDPSLTMSGKERVK